jgi:hypothetical protein
MGRGREKNERERSSDATNNLTTHRAQMLPCRAVRRAALALFFACFSGLSLLGTGACSFDWNVREATAADASKDAGAEAEASVEEAGPMVDATPAMDSGDIDAAPDCVMLAASITSAETNARACTLGVPSDCAATVKDECDCPIFVGVANSAGANGFAAAVADYKNAGCMKSCSGCPSHPVQGTCLQMGGMTYLCSPFP